MYAEVVVLTYQAPDIGSFTYEIPKNLEGKVKIGQLVQVPFGKRKPLGVVTASHNRHPRESENRILDQLKNDTKTIIKPISEIVLPNPLLLPCQLNLLKWMAGYYFAPMVDCLEAMLPPIPKKPLSLESSFARRGLAKLGETIVLFPSINRLPETLAQFPSAKNYVLYHNQLKASERFANWLKILNGQADFVFGSRSAIFASCPNLTKIIIFNEHDGAYKDERSPYFDTLTVAEKLQELTGAKLEIIDSSPKVTTYFVHKKNVILDQVENQFLSKTHTDSRLRGNDKKKNARATGARVEIVSMANEKQAGNRSPISSVLAEEIKKLHKTNGRALLFLNKKAESGQIYCNACKQQNFAFKIPTTCPNCKSPDIFFHSLNINSLSNEVKKIVPQSNLRFLTEGYRLQTTDYRLPTVDISTSAIFYAQVFQKYDLVAHISTDSVLNIADLKTSEKLYSQIADLKKLTKNTGLLILQTYNPESDLLKNAAQGDFTNFYLNELNARKMLLYPPYSLLVKLTIKGNKQDLIFQKAKNLIENLKSVHELNYKSGDPIILGPYEPVFLGKTPRYNIILKVKLNSYDIETKEKTLKGLSPYLSKVPKGWQISVEPDSLN